MIINYNQISNKLIIIYKLFFIINYTGRDKNEKA